MASDKNSTSNAPLGGAEIGASQLTSSGLKITELVLGDGLEATPGTSVSVNYKGTLDDGKEFDSSYGRGPFEFSLGAGMVIKGWDEGVAGMKVDQETMSKLVALARKANVEGDLPDRGNQMGRNCSRKWT